MRTLATTVSVAFLSFIPGAAQVSLAQSTYRVDVVTHDGQTRFDDCLTFGGKGDLDIASAHMPLVWVRSFDKGTGTAFAAVNLGAELHRHAFGLAVHGELRDDEILVGHAINEFGTTFSFAGRAVDKCLVEPAGSAFDTISTAPARAKPEPTGRPADSLIARAGPATTYRPPPVGGPAAQPRAGALTPRDPSIVRRPPAICPGLPQDPTAGSPAADNYHCPHAGRSAKGGSPDRIRTFRVALYDGAWYTDCWHFGGNGRFWSDAGLEQIWGSESRHQPLATVQTVGVPAPGLNFAVHGRLSPWGSLQIDAIASDADGSRPVMGHGYTDSSCSLF